MRSINRELDVEPTPDKALTAVLAKGPCLNLLAYDARRAPSPDGVIVKVLCDASKRLERRHCLIEDSEAFEEHSLEFLDACGEADGAA